MANIAPFLVMNYLKRKEKEKQERENCYQETTNELGEAYAVIESRRNKRPKIKVSEYNDLPEDVKDLIAYGVIELE